MSAVEPESRPDPVPPSDAAAKISPSDIPPATAVTPLSAEEQMAAFEKDLKENDWGHQPC